MAKKNKALSKDGARGAAAAKAAGGSAGNERKAVKPGFFIVGIGASAGGLESIEVLFRAMPADSGLAFVLVTHLESGHVSYMPELLQKITPLRVSLAENGMKVQPNHIFIIPPDRDLVIKEGALKLMKAGTEGTLRLPINTFLRSLAEDAGDRAIGIILSGMGSDGTLGLRAIKGQLGMSMVQDPGSAKFDGMPRSAIEAGLADYILAPERMPGQLLEYTGRESGHSGVELPVSENVEAELRKVLYMIREVTGHDLSSYKRTTITRRIDRRMHVHQIDQLAHYVRYLQSNRHEIELLFKDLLINVTGFFRDAEAFELLEKRVLPPLLAAKGSGDTIRVWVAGCSSGEEACSIAILIREWQEQQGRHFKVQIFATDIDEEAIDAARLGVYPAAIVEDVGKGRLRRYFEKEEGGWRIRKEIREMLIYAPQDMIKDPPFTRLDLIGCRNVLIYLETDLQRRLLPMFHYALRPGGVLFLGSSESIGELTDLFTVVDKKWKIFQRRDTLAPEAALFDLPLGLRHEMPPAGAAPAAAPGVNQLVERVLLEHYAPPCVIVNGRGAIHFIHGRTGKYLEPAAGSPSMNLVEMAREGLKLPLPAALRKAQTERREIVYERLKVKTNGGCEPVTLRVRPITGVEALSGLLLVSFEDAPAPPAPAKGEARKGERPAKVDRRIPELELELKNARESLQSTIEEMETANEELKSMNEEYQSTNEELKSANEELETSREEMQSLNEELTTVNAELQEKIDNLSKAHRDLKDSLDSIEIPTIFLDSKLCVKRFTNQANRIVNLIATDAGRPVGHIVGNLKYDRLTADAAQVLRTLRSIEKEVEDKDGHWYFMRIHPYRTMENVLDGVAITFTNIDELKRTSDELVSARQALLDAMDMLDAMRDPVLVLDGDRRAISVNRAFLKTFGMKKERVLGQSIYEIHGGSWDCPGLRGLLEGGKSWKMERLEIKCDLPRVGRRALEVKVHRIAGKPPAENRYLLVIEGAEGK